MYSLIRTATLTTFAFVLLINLPQIRAQNYKWAKSMGGTGTDLGRSSCVDVSGNIYAVGYFQNTVDFDPSGGVANLTSAGSYDVYVAKYDANGNYLWAKNIGGKGNDYSSSITLDNSGNIYVTGYFSDTVDVDPSAAIVNLISAGATDIFMAKYTSSGNYVWAMSMGDVLSDEAYHLFVKGSEILLVGGFQGTADFDPSGAVANFTSVGGYDIFIAKYDTSAKYIWARTMGGSGADLARNVCIASTGHIYFTGEFSNTVDFDPSATVMNISSIGGADVFIAKYDASGDYVWAGAVGGPSSDNAGGIGLDGDGNAYTAGYFLGKADLDPFAGELNFTSAGLADVFITKVTSSGTFIWSKTAGGTSNDIVYGFYNDLSSIYLTGYFEGKCDFDPSAAENTLTSSGSRDIFIARYDTAGRYVWAGNPGGTGNDFGRDIDVNVQGDLIITGYFDAAADFDVSTSVANLTPTAGFDVFVAKYCQPPVTASSVTGEDTLCYGSSGRIYSLPMAYTSSYVWQVPTGATIVNGNGTPSITIDYGSSNGGNITVNGTNACGTGPAYTLPVTINQLPPAPVIGSNTPVCELDSLHLTASNIAGATYSWNGPNGFSSLSQHPSIPQVTAAASGTYTVSASVKGCVGAASTASISVIMLPPAPTPLSNSPLCQNADLNLTASDVSGASYTWTGPNGFTASTQHPTISKVTPAAAGTYSVQATVNGCPGPAGTLNVTVHPLPVPTAGSNSPVCENAALNFTATTITGASYSWNGPAGFSSASQNPSISNATLAASGTYTVVATAYGCSGPASTVAVIVNANPAPVLESNSPVCTGNTLNLAASAVPGGIYSWSGPNGFASNLQNPIRSNVSLADSGNYFVLVTANNCTSSPRSLRVKIKESPPAPVTNSPVAVCEKASVELTASAIPGASYSWTSSNGFTSSLQNPIIASVSLAASGTYSVIATVDGCTGPAGTVSVTVTPVPAAPVAGSSGTICEGTTLFLTASTVTGAVYKWTGPNGFVSAEQNPSIPFATTAATGTYTVTAHSHGCYSPPATTHATVKLCSGIGENNNGYHSLKIHPNPLHQQAQVVISEELLKHSGELYFVMYNIIGKEIRTIRVKEAHFVFERHNLSQGVYFYQLINEKNIVAAGKVVIQ